MHKPISSAEAMAQAHTGIELWLVELARCGPALDALDRETPRLADDGHARADALRVGIERRERLCAYIALRVVLERAAGIGIRRCPLVRCPGRAPRLAAGGPRGLGGRTGARRRSFIMVTAKRLRSCNVQSVTPAPGVEPFLAARPAREAR